MESLGIHDQTLQAFTLEPIQVGDVVIYPGCFAHLMALRKHVPNFDGGQLTPEEVLQAIVVFSTPPKEAASLLSMPRQAWDERVQQAAGSVMVMHLSLYMSAIQKQLNAAVAPAIQAKGANVGVNPDSGKKKAASAGGSKRSSVRSRSTTFPGNA